ncbi:MAG TPA: T9SS type A sorting domain-containing protein [Candidatus Marinimicrobia bacterium]|nr:T9SS type A sorting domain-containing protein [Candidatus Neomarinimicrobiota bacterium]
MRNGVTDALTTFNATDNTSLSCIEVLDRDIDWATTNWTYENGNIDEGVTFAVACGNFNLHVATTGSDSTGDGTYENPFATIQKGIDAANSGDTVSVAAGTYVENISYSGKNISVFGEDRETTIIDGNETASVVVFNGWEDSTAHLSGFTLTNGLPTGAWPASRGGGINCQQASPTLSNLLITGNSSTAGGGGIYLYSGSDAKITDVIIKENIGGWGGGGMYIEGSDAELTNVHIHSNDDGGVKLQNADVSFNYVTISDNESYGMHIEYSEPTFNHVTIVNNDTYGVGLYSTWSHPVFTNSIIANNGTQVTTNQSTGPYGISVSYSNIQGGLDELDSLEFDPDSVNWNSGNINANPLFCEPDSNNYHLSENSPCLGSGQDGSDMGAFGVGCGTLDIEFPSIVDIWDVPDDQGNWVYIQFNPSVHDASDEGPFGLYNIERLDDEEWVSLHSIVAYGADYYTTEAHTLMDSTEEDDGMTSYRVVAAMDDVGVLISEPAAGYSIDNIAPGVPTGLMATISEVGIHLSWDLSTAEDFQYFDLEKSSTADFGEYQVIETADTAYLDTDYEVNVTVYYRLVAYDDGGNASEHSVAIDITVLWADLGIAIPDEFAIHQNYPNPFNPVTTLRYDLPENGLVNITIYDMLGRQVKTLVNQTQDAGYRSVVWDATNDYGKPVSAGIYLYQIHAGEYMQTKKMVLLK